MTFNSKTTANLLRKQTQLRPSLAMVLGSGFQHAVTHLDADAEVPYGRLPGFTSVGVSGHVGRIVIGKLGKTPVLVLKGRTHFYEGHEMERVTFPIRVLADFGIRSLLLTNAAGGINRKFKPGEFMALTDHINFMGANPLRGPAFPGLPRFVDMTRVYDVRLNDLLKRSARVNKMRLHSGVYLATQGPSYETPAEVRAFSRLGADAVGMSTVPEAIVARQCGMAVAAVSCITNLAAGIGKGELSHAEVLATAEQRKTVVAAFLKTFCELYGKG